MSKKAILISIQPKWCELIASDELAFLKKRAIAEIFSQDRRSRGAMLRSEENDKLFWKISDDKGFLSVYLGSL